jgi:hypothetical protein
VLDGVGLIGGRYSIWIPAKRECNFKAMARGQKARLSTATGHNKAAMLIRVHDSTHIRAGFVDPDTNGADESGLRTHVGYPRVRRMTQQRKNNRQSGGRVFCGK